MVDYSHWKHIEISDDEDETHPNIDTPSLYRWRHQARIDRMDEMKKEREELDKKKKLYESQLKEVKEKVRAEVSEEIEVGLNKQLKALEIAGKKLNEAEEDLNRREKKAPWNIDTISKPGFQKTLINNNSKKKSDDDLTDEEKENEFRTFVKKNDALIKKYGMLRKFEDSKKFLQENLQLVNENTANHLVILCIKYEIDKKHELMKHMAHQCICMQFILELGKQLNVDPRAYIASFFAKMEETAEYRQHIKTEIASFIERIEKRALEKIEEAAADLEEEERQSRLGPGGLDPFDIFNELPEELQSCFESRNIKLLQETIEKMPEDKARYYMQRCIDSGLWLPGARDKESETELTTSPADDSETKGDTAEKEEKVYVDVADLD